MVILYVLSGIIFGSAAAAFTVWSGGSILLAVIAYSLIGTIGALGSVMALYFLHEGSPDVGWPPKESSNDPVSA